jgi:dethiobiotin synthetase
MKKPPFGLFVTGNNTEVGKTFVSALIAKQLVTAGKKVGVYKPAASGCQKVDGRLVSEDVEALRAAAGNPGTVAEICPQMFEAPLAPHLAARAEGKELNAKLLRTGISAWAGKCDVVIVEGAGGLMSPISDDEYVADLALDLGYPMIVVAANRLGVINETLQTLITATAFAEGLEVAGVVLNDLNPAGKDISRDSNKAQLESRCGPPILGHVSHNASDFPAEIDWISLIQNYKTLNQLANQ